MIIKIVLKVIVLMLLVIVIVLIIIVLLIMLWFFIAFFTSIPPIIFPSVCKVWDANAHKVNNREYTMTNKEWNGKQSSGANLCFKILGHGAGNLQPSASVSVAGQGDNHVFAAFASSVMYQFIQLQI